MTMTQQEISALSTEELRLLNTQICDELKTRARTKARQAAFSLEPGQRVSWPGKYGGRMTGKILSVGPRNTKCLADNGQQWRVANTLITVEA